MLQEIKADSAASKSGLKKNDILLELDGKSVPSKVEDATKVLNDIKPKTPVDATVLRKGKRETVKGIELPEAKAEETPRAGKRQEPAKPEVPAFPRLQPQFPLGGGQGAASNIQMIRTNDSFTTRYRKDGGYIALTGKMNGNKAEVEEIMISTGKDTKKFKTVEEVPEDMRDQVKALLRMTEKGTVSTLELEIK